MDVRGLLRRHQKLRRSPWIHLCSPAAVAFQNELSGNKGSHSLHLKPLTHPCSYGGVAAGSLGGARADRSAEGSTMIAVMMMMMLIN